MLIIAKEDIYPFFNKGDIKELTKDELKEVDSIAKVRDIKLAYEKYDEKKIEAERKEAERLKKEAELKERSEIQEGKKIETEKSVEVEAKK